MQLTELALLSELRDIRFPEPVSWWPPAPGWWIVGVVTVVVVVLVVMRVRRHLLSPAREAQHELVRIRKNYQTTRDTLALAGALSVFLRRAVLAVYPRTDVAGLTGNAWLEFLDRTGATVAFADGPGEGVVNRPLPVID